MANANASKTVTAGTAADKVNKGHLIAFHCPVCGANTYCYEGADLKCSNGCQDKAEKSTKSTKTTATADDSTASTATADTATATADTKETAK